MNNLIVLSFLGTRYHGFQVQQNALSICEVLQDAMEKLFGMRPDVKGCSRTDAGVHAREYYLNFHMDTGIPQGKLPLALNNFLPWDIRVLKARKAADDFHARYSCVSKTYEYIILNSHIDDPFTKGQYFRVPYKLDGDKMNEAAQYFLGKHDFSAFMSKNSNVEDTVRNISNSYVRRDGERLIFTVSADGFLYNMVRIMAGTLLWAGCGRIKPEDAAKIIESRNRKNAGSTLAAEGLFLTKVEYGSALFI